MAKPLSDKEIRKLHDEALKTPSFIKKLNQYKKDKIAQYAQTVIQRKYDVAINWVKHAKLEYPDEYKNGNELNYWLERSSVGDDIRKEETLLKRLKQPGKKNWLKKHRKEMEALDQEILRQNKKLREIETKRTISEVTKLFTDEKYKYRLYEKFHFDKGLTWPKSHKKLISHIKKLGISDAKKLVNPDADSFYQAYHKYLKNNDLNSQWWKNPN